MLERSPEVTPKTPKDRQVVVKRSGPTPDLLSVRGVNGLRKLHFRVDVISRDLQQKMTLPPKSLGIPKKKEPIPKTCAVDVYSFLDVDRI